MTDESRPSTMSTQFKRDYSEGLASYAPTIFRGLEAIISVLCIGFLDDPFNATTRQRLFIEPRTAAIAYSTFATFIIVCSVHVIGKCFRESIPWKTSALFSLIGIILYITCAFTIINGWSDAKLRPFWPPNTHRLDFTITTGILSIVGALLFLLDFLFTVQQGSKGNLE